MKLFIKFSCDVCLLSRSLFWFISFIQNFGGGGFLVILAKGLPFFLEWFPESQVLVALIGLAKFSDFLVPGGPSQPQGRPSPIRR